LRSGNLRERRPHGAPDAHQVDLDDPLPFLGRHRPRGRPFGRDPGIRHRDVQTAEALDRLGDGGHHGAGVGDVGADPQRPLADPLRRLARLLGVEVEDHDRGAALVQLASRLESDPSRGAGDQRDFSVEVVGRRHRQSVFQPM
jgi:hypothetical protein